MLIFLLNMQFFENKKSVKLKSITKNGVKYHLVYTLPTARRNLFKLYAKYASTKLPRFQFLNLIARRYQTFLMSPKTFFPLTNRFSCCSQCIHTCNLLFLESCLGRQTFLTRACVWPIRPCLAQRKKSHLLRI